MGAQLGIADDPDGQAHHSPLAWVLHGTDVHGACILCY